MARGFGNGSENMGQALPWAAVGLSALVLAYAGLRGRAGSGALPPGAGTVLGGSVAVLLVGVLIALPTGAPWSGGQALIPGLILGGAAVFAGALLGNPARFADDPGGALGAAARLAAGALALGVAAGLYGPFRHGFLDLLAGCSLGALAVGLLLAGGFALAQAGDSPVAEAAAQAALATAAVGAAAYLAALHQNPAGERDWLPFPALLAATFAAGAALRGALGAVGIGAFLVVAAPGLAMAWLVAHPLGGSPAFFRTVALALAAYGVIAWVGESSREDGGVGARPDLGLIGALVVLGVGALAFRELHGYGLALAALTGVGLLAATSKQTLLPGAVTLGLLLALYRVFTEANAYTRGFQPDFLYYYLALALGGLAPLLLAGVMGRSGSGTAASLPGFLRAGLAGLGALALPLAVWVLVGERPQAALVVGLGLGGAFILSRPTVEGAQRLNLAGLLSLAAAWSAIQFTHLLAPLALRTRPQRVGILVAAGAVILLGLAFTAALERREARPES
jgi:hypothetical protein